MQLRCHPSAPRCAAVWSRCSESLGVIHAVVRFQVCTEHPGAPLHVAHPIARSPFAPFDVNGTATVLDAIHRSARARELEMLAVAAIRGQETAAETAAAAFHAGFQAGAAETDFYS